MSYFVLVLCIQSPNFGRETHLTALRDHHEQCWSSILTCKNHVFRSSDHLPDLHTKFLAEILQT